MDRLTFRQRIFFSYFLLFLLFMIIITPFSNYLVKKIIVKSMDDQAESLIERIKNAPTQESLLLLLKGQKPVIFFRVGIINDEMKVLYDSHAKRVIGNEFEQDYVITHPEVKDAFEKGIGYHEEYSAILDQKFAYFAKAFDFHGHKYVLRVAFPFQYVEQLLRDFQKGFLLMSAVALSAFTLLTWYIIYRITRPIEQIIKAVKPYQEGLKAEIPEIIIHSANPNDEFGRLASTLNSLSGKIKRHIANLVEERKEKEAILESLIEGVIAVDNQMLVTYANQAAQQLLGFSKDELVGRDFMLTEQKECDQLLLACQDEETVKTGSIKLGRGANALYIDLVAVPIKGKIGAVLVVRDKTAHHKMMTMRKDFVANASHELKTPIQIILGFAETLHDNEDLSTEKQKEITDKIVKNCVRMNNIIQDLLILSDIENLPSSRLDECNLYELAQHCKQTLHALYPDANVVIEKKMQGDPVMVGDTYLLELALNNLMGNAAKYSTGPAEIKIVISKVGEFLKVAVSDKGIGIPESDLEFLFQRFYTVNKAHSRKLGGSGLGLSIVQTIVEKHYGQITVESELSKGSTFTLLLPIHKLDFFRNSI